MSHSTPSRHSLVPLDHAGFRGICQSSNNHRMALALSELWEAKALGVDGQGRIVVGPQGRVDPSFLLEKARRPLKLFFVDGFFLLVPDGVSSLTRRSFPDILVAAGCQQEGRWFLHPTPFSTRSLSQRTAASLPKIFHDHPAPPAAAGRLDPLRPLWSLPAAHNSTDLPEEVSELLSTLLLGAMVDAALSTGHDPGAQISGHVRVQAKTHGTSLAARILLGTRMATAHCWRLVHLLHRMMEHGLLPETLALCHPLNMHDALCHLVLSEASAHHRLDSLRRYSDLCASLGVPSTDVLDPVLL